MSDVWSDLRVALRGLAKHPGYAAAAALTLAIGIGANVALFTVVNAVLLRPLPFPESDRIVTVRHHAPGLELPELQSSPGLIAHYREGARTLERIGAFTVDDFNLSGAGDPERVRTVAVTPELFDVLRTRPALGRAFSAADAEKDAPPVVILTHALWTARFGGDPGAVGRRIRLDGRDTEIVGVMPPGFVFPDVETRALSPLWIDPEGGFGEFGPRAIARLAPGATLAGAQQEVADLQRRLPERFPDLTPDMLERFGWSASVQGLRDDLVGDVSRSLWVMFGAVALVLVIGAANVATLFLIRAESRRHDVGVRAALGASRIRLARAFVAEGLLLASAAGIAGALLAAAGIRLLVTTGPSDVPRLHEVSIDGAALAFGIAVALAAGVTLGLLPMWTVSRRALGAVLGERGAGAARRDGHRARQILVAAQVAVSLVLLASSALMVQSLREVQRVDPGFRTENLITVGVSLGQDVDRQRAVAFHRRVLEEVESLPGVISAGASTTLPIAATSMGGGSFEIESRPRPDDEIPPVTMYAAVMPGYFETLGVPIVAGRPPGSEDLDAARSSVWVNQTFARQFLEDRVIGERIRLEDTWLEIAGVVGDTRVFGLREDVRPMAYVTPAVALGRATRASFVYLVVRSSTPPQALVDGIRRTVTGLDPSVPLITARTIDDLLRTSLAQMAFTMTLLGVAAAVALTLSVIGLYGAVSYQVTRRTGEIGIRMALGARPMNVRALVLRQGLAVTLAGVAIGLAAAAAITQALASLLYGVSPADPATFAAVALLLTSVSTAAAYLPARRASKLEPVAALRQLV